MTEDKQPLEKRLLDDISKTGFPLELRIGNTLTQQGYYVEHNVYYTDLDNKDVKEKS